MVDDGSTDGTVSLMKKLAETRPNVKLGFNKKNIGGGATRNEAVKLASSDVIFCLDSDDILPDGSLAKMYRLLKNKKCDAVGIHRSIKFRGKNHNDVVRTDVFGYPNERIPFESLIEKAGQTLCPLYSTFMFTKRAFEISGGYPIDHGFDTQSLPWRFLSKGLIAYGCKDAEYLHRLHFTKSYYLREYESGKINHNWFKIFEEFMYLFTAETQQALLSFDLNNSTESLSQYIFSRNNILKDDYTKYIGVAGQELYESEIANSAKPLPQDLYWLAARRFHQMKYAEAYDILEQAIQKGIHHGYAHKYLAQAGDSIHKKSPYVDNGVINSTFKYVKQGSSAPIIKRIVRKIIRVSRNKLKNTDVVRKYYYFLAGAKNNIVSFIHERMSYGEYQKAISQCIEKKEIVLKMDWGGLGDVLVYSQMPRILKEKYGVDFYLSTSCKKVFRHPDIFELCFGLNPYFKGFKDGPSFTYRRFSHDRSLLNLLLDIRGSSIPNNILRQFNIRAKADPEVFYKPKQIATYRNIILVDLNFISGYKLGWKYDTAKIQRYIDSLTSPTLTVEYVDPKKQDIYTYADMIHSCKTFVTVLSGGAALAAALKKDAVVFLPTNVRGESVYNFTFRDSPITYIP